jgi:predicted component of type VI protein secretion system
MPQFWIAIFFMLLAAAQLYESIKEIELPLPVYLVLGTILAITSNYQQQFSVTGDRKITQIPNITTDPVLSSSQKTLLAAVPQQDLD